MELKYLGTIKDIKNLKEEEIDLLSNDIVRRSLINYIDGDKYRNGVLEIEILDLTSIGSSSINLVLIFKIFDRDRKNKYFFKIDERNKFLEVKKILSLISKNI